MDWMGFGFDVGSGLAGGCANQALLNLDDNRAKEKAAGGGDLDFMSQYTTYSHFLLPVADVVAVATGVLKGDWARRLTVISGMLAGSKLVHKLQNERHNKGYPGSDNTVGYSGGNQYRLKDNKREAPPEQGKKIVPVTSVMEI